MNSNAASDVWKFITGVGELKKIRFAYFLSRSLLGDIPRYIKLTIIFSLAIFQSSYYNHSQFHFVLQSKLFYFLFKLIGRLFNVLKGSGLNYSNNDLEIFCLTCYICPFYCELFVKKSPTLQASHIGISNVSHWISSYQIWKFFQSSSALPDASSPKFASKLMLWRVLELFREPEESLNEEYPRDLAS